MDMKMEIRNKRVDVEKVELIDFKDVKKYANVAYLVDRDDFLKEIRIYRNKLQKQVRVKLPLQWESHTLWYEKLWTLTEGELSKIKREVKEAEKQYYKAVYTEQNLQEATQNFENKFRLNPSENFDLDVRNIRKKYKQFLFMEKVIGKAIIYNEIHEEDYIDCYAEILYPTSEYPFLLDYPKLVIVLTPYTKFPDVERVYDYEVGKLTQEYKDLELAPEYSAVSSKEKKLIIRDRGWYWLRKESGKSYEEISKTCPFLHNQLNNATDKNLENCLWCNSKNSSYEDIRKAVNRYKKWLYNLR